MMSAIQRTGIVLCVLAVACTEPTRDPLIPSPPPPVTPPPPEPPAPPPPPVTPTPPQLPAGVYRLDGIAATAPYSDLEPLRAIVGTATFVALGESTHTSAGYYQAKGRFIRYLVEQMGFRFIAFESNWLEGQTATNYVASCAGSSNAALASLFSVWRDSHVRDLLQWLCTFNQQHPSDPVTFLGIDIQEPWRSIPAFRDFVGGTQPDYVANTNALDQCLGASASNINQFYQSQQYKDHAAGNRNHSAHSTCLNAISALEGWLATNSTALQAASSGAELEEARLMLLSARAAEQQYWLPDPEWYEVRDRAMADMTLRLRALHAPAEKTILWAWNWHIARAYQDVRGFNADSLAHIDRQGGRSMGHFLTEQLGVNYRPIGIIGYEVHTWSPLTKPPLPTIDQAVEKKLHDLDGNYLLVDLRDPLIKSFLPAERRYLISQEWGNPYQQFDALLFLEYSGAMTFINPVP